MVFVPVAAAIAVYFAVESNHRSRQFDEWLVAEPTRFSADLSRTGTWEAPFIQTCQISHGQSIILMLPDLPEHPPAIVAGLKGTLEVVRPGGEAVVTLDFPHEFFLETSRAEEGIELARFHPFENGAYMLRIQVAEPAPALAGHSQVVLARYRLCGLEKLWAFIAAVFSIAAGLPAVVVGTFTIIGLARHGWRQGGTTRGAPQT